MSQYDDRVQFAIDHAGACVTAKGFLNRGEVAHIVGYEKRDGYLVVEEARSASEGRPAMDRADVEMVVKRPLSGRFHFVYPDEISLVKGAEGLPRRFGRPKSLDVPKDIPWPKGDITKGLSRLEKIEKRLTKPKTRARSKQVQP